LLLYIHVMSIFYDFSVLYIDHNCSFMFLKRIQMIRYYYDIITNHDIIQCTSMNDNVSRKHFAIGCQIYWLRMYDGVWTIRAMNVTPELWNLGYERSDFLGYMYYAFLCTFNFDNNNSYFCFVFPFEFNNRVVISATVLHKIYL